ncbi:MarR family winged helix-turn-helix transcriptional regulator [Anaeroselena agilis]|uniref:MarR family transcriptional regulator n=1 Tax=Anaeroselena agilis TaxID=3063788 RepID=A0ABU3P031_9FIRM|nr:MarR family transcriptional regulator [Selenomonadales bacterium 4137-cl]
MEYRAAAADKILHLAFILHKKLVRPVVLQAKADLSPLQFHVLDTLRDNGAATMTLLANEIRMSKQQMTRVVDSLVSQGLVRRDFDGLDRRIIRISPTAAGLAVLEDLKKEACQALLVKLASVADEDLAEYNAAADRLARLLKELP